MEEEIIQSEEQIPQKVQIDPESAGQQLEDLLNGINEAHEKENATLEASLYKEARDLFKKITGQDLMQKAEAAAKEEIESEGSKMSPKNDFFSDENIKKQINGFKFSQQISALQKAWDLISEEEKKSYLGETSNFVAAIEKKMEEIKKIGIDISKEVCFNLMANGYMVYGMKKSIWNGKIKIPIYIGRGATKYQTMSIRDLSDSITMMQGLVDLMARQAVDDRLRKKLLYAKRRWQKRRMRKIREILKAVIKTRKSEEKDEAEKMEIRKRLEEEIRGKVAKQIEAEEREALEKISNIGEVGVLERLRDFERLEKKTDRNIKKEIQKMGKSLEKDIAEREQEEKKITEIMKKQQQKGAISKKRTAYINNVSKTEEEKNKITAPPEEPTQTLTEEAAKISTEEPEPTESSPDIATQATEPEASPTASEEKPAE